MGFVTGFCLNFKADCYKTALTQALNSRKHVSNNSEDQDISYQMPDKLKILFIIAFKDLFSCKHIRTHKIFRRIFFSQFI